MKRTSAFDSTSTLFDAMHEFGDWYRSGSGSGVQLARPYYHHHLLHSEEDHRHQSPVTAATAHLAQQTGGQRFDSNNNNNNNNIEKEEARDGLFLFQRLSDLLQRFKDILLRDSFTTSDASDL